MSREHVRRATVLVVEDVDWIRAGMRAALLRYGYRVLEASSAAEALQAASDERPDLIVTEEEVPTLGMLLESVHAHTALESVPVVIINPDEKEGIHYGDIIVLTDYDHIGPLLGASQRNGDGE